MMPLMIYDDIAEAQWVTVTEPFLAAAMSSISSRGHQQYHQSTAPVYGYVVNIIRIGRVAA